MKRRHLISLALLAGTAARAQPNGLVEGQNFVRLEKPQGRPAGGKIDVIEFFSYACPHCHAFEPDLDAWIKRVPQDVAVRRVPVPFLANAANFQRTYYALEALGLVDAVQSKVFAAVHVQGLRLGKPEEIADLVARNGGDAAKFLAHFQSFSVAAAQTRASKMTDDYAVDGVPSLVVDGRYQTSPGMAGGPKQALAVVDALIQRVRRA